MSSLYHNFIFNPLYNLLVGIFSLFSWVDAGIAVILLTVIVRLILFPLSKKSVLTQVRMRQIAPLLEEIKAKYKNPEEQARKTLALYKEQGVNPFSGIFLILLQLPVIWALYQIFLKAGFPAVNTEILYSFVKVPEFINIEFLGLLDITKQSLILAVLAAISTYFQIKLATAKMSTAPSTSGSSFGNDLAKSMQTQMKYFFPIIVLVIAYKISGVIALYWLTSNLFTIAQELWIQKKYPTQLV